MRNLESLGWNDRREAQFTPHAADGLTPARVVREDRDRYRVHDATERPAAIAGRLRHAAQSRLDFPAVGDWVAIRGDGDGSATIVAVLPRASAFVRHAAGEVTEPQVVAANIDTVFVVAGLDGDWNPRRLERYVTAAWESGAVPVIVLNKADLSDDVEARIAETELAAPGVTVVAVAALEGSRLDSLAPWLTPGATVALLGSSGVGKSTLVNALLGEARQATGAVREDDSRGRHTTSHRELVPLPGGAVLIDTPGMRELQLWADGGDEALADAFPDVEALAASCRFGDCAHESEPGCAVRAALQSGALDAERFGSWRKLQRELRYQAGKQDRRIRMADAAKWRAVHQSMKSHPKLKQRGLR